MLTVVPRVGLTVGRAEGCADGRSCPGL